MKNIENTILCVFGDPKCTFAPHNAHGIVETLLLGVVKGITDPLHANLVHFRH